MPREAECLQAHAREPYPVSLDYMNREDLHSVLAIERASFEHPWFERDFLRYLKDVNATAEAARYPSGRIAGYCVRELHKTRCYIMNLAVDPIDRRRGVGRQIIDHVKAMLVGSRRRIVLDIRETNLVAQLFFRAMGFRCVNTRRNHYAATADDAYRFQYRIGD